MWIWLTLENEYLLINSFLSKPPLLFKFIWKRRFFADLCDFFQYWKLHNSKWAFLLIWENFSKYHVWSIYKREAIYQILWIDFWSMQINDQLWHNVWSFRSRIELNDLSEIFKLFSKKYANCLALLCYIIKFRNFEAFYFWKLALSKRIYLR